MMEEDPSTNILNELKKKYSHEESWDRIIKIGLEYYKKVEGNAV